MVQSQKQKLSRRKIIILSASCVGLICIGLTLFFNLSRQEDSKASGIQQAVGRVELEEPAYTDSKSVPVPMIRQLPVTDGQTVFARKAKATRTNLTQTTN